MGRAALAAIVLSVAHVATASYCPGGQYCGYSCSAYCSNCPAGKSTQSSRGCYTCSTSSRACSSCSSGKYSSSGSSFCTTCPSGRTSSAGSSRCSSSGPAPSPTCAAGKYCGGSCAVYCDKCPTGKYTGASGCGSCSSSSRACKSCPSGKSTYATGAGAAFCGACPVGKYQSQSGQAQCPSCPAGRYQSSTGTTLCQSCPRGKSPAGASSSSQCTSGGGGGGGSSKGCSAGKYCGTSCAFTCSSCPSGYYTGAKGSDAATAASGCIACPVGKYDASSLGGAAFCSACPAGKTSPSTATGWSGGCSVSTSGGSGKDTCKYAKDGECDEPDGYCAKGTDCTDCGKCSGSTACFDKTDSGFMYNDGGDVPCSFFQSNRKYCSQSKYKAKLTANCGKSCGFCKGGSAQKTSSCAAGKYGISTCRGCPSGKFASSRGSISVSQCLGCPVGRYTGSSSSSSCSACPYGKSTKASGATSSRQCASACPSGKFKSKNSCVSCSPGTFGGGNFDACSSCPRGRYGTQTGSSRSSGCRSCPRGRWSAEAASTSAQCTGKCSAGRYKRGAAANYCYSCPSGKTSAAGALHLSECNMPSATCKRVRQVCFTRPSTSGGASRFDKCKLPFTYSPTFGSTSRHSTCTTTGHDKLWCYTKNSRGGQSSNWGPCMCSSSSCNWIFFAAMKTWSEARGECRRLGRDLLSIHSTSENAEMYKMTNGKESWIGMRASSSSRQSWADRSSYRSAMRVGPLKGGPWGSNEPSSSGCVAANHPSYAGVDGWATLSCSQRKNFICGGCDSSTGKECFMPTAVGDVQGNSKCDRLRTVKGRTATGARVTSSRSSALGFEPQSSFSFNGRILFGKACGSLDYKLGTETYGTAKGAVTLPVIDFEQIFDYTVPDIISITSELRVHLRGNPCDANHALVVKYKFTLDYPNMIYDVLESSWKLAESAGVSSLLPDLPSDPLVIEGETDLLGENVGIKLTTLLEKTKIGRKGKDLLVWLGTDLTFKITDIKASVGVPTGSAGLAFKLKVGIEVFDLSKGNICTNSYTGGSKYCCVSTATGPCCKSSGSARTACPSCSSSSPFGVGRSVYYIGADCSAATGRTETCKICGTIKNFIYQKMVSDGNYRLGSNKQIMLIDKDVDIISFTNSVLRASSITPPTWLDQRRDMIVIGNPFATCKANGVTRPAGPTPRPRPAPTPRPRPSPAPTPAGTGSCTFESFSICSWTKSGKNRWTRGSSTPSDSTGAKQAQGGSYFMYIETSSPSSTGDTSYLTSPKVSGLGSVSFYYHMHGATMGVLSVEALVGSSWKSVWSKSGQQQSTQGAAWLSSGKVSLPSGTTRVRFKGVAGSSFTGDMSIDSVTFAKGGCAFESASMCGWKKSGGTSNTYWARGSSTPSSSTGATSAQGGSNFMFLESSGGSKGDTAYITSSSIAGKGFKTMSFYYHMHGSNMGTLQIELSCGYNCGSSPWKKTGQQQSSQSSSWLKATVALPSNMVAVRFKGVRGNGFKSDMSFDSVVFSKGASSVSCAGSYGSWGSCSKTCGAGSRTATYKVTTAASGGGTACPAATKSQACTVKACPVSCVGAYGAWGSCSKTCGAGTQTSVYTVTTAAANGGRNCGQADASTRSKACQIVACPLSAPQKLPPVDAAVELPVEVLTPGSVARTTFETTFTADMAKLARLKASDVKVLSVTKKARRRRLLAGNVDCLVKFQITMPVGTTASHVASAKAANTPAAATKAAKAVVATPAFAAVVDAQFKQEQALKKQLAAAAKSGALAPAVSALALLFAVLVLH